jgi:hypothetical protein
VFASSLTIGTCTFGHCDVAHALVLSLRRPYSLQPRIKTCPSLLPSSTLSTPGGLISYPENDLITRCQECIDEVGKSLSQATDSKRYQLADPTILRKLHNIRIHDLGELGRCTNVVTDVFEHYYRDENYVTAHRHQLIYTQEEFMATPFNNTATYLREARLVACRLECSRNRTEELEKLARKSLIFCFIATPPMPLISLSIGSLSFFLKPTMLCRASQRYTI